MEESVAKIQQQATRNPEAEAQRKRSERLLTNLRAGLGDAEAETRLDAEVERGIRRRVEARERALQLRSTVNTARALRAQLTVQAMALPWMSCSGQSSNASSQGFLGEMTVVTHPTTTSCTQPRAGALRCAAPARWLDSLGCCN